MKTLHRPLLALGLLCFAAPAAGAVFTVTRTFSSGNGSLRTAITGANGAPGSTIRFAIATNDSGYDPATGVFTIHLSSALPAITAAGTILDATTQTAAIGNTNPGVLGAGGTVGTGALALSTVDRPEVLLLGDGSFPIGLDVQAANVTIRGLAISGFGAAPGVDTSATIRVGAAGAGALIERNVLGTGPTAFADPGAAARTRGDNIRIVSADNGVVRNNLIGFAAGNGVELNTGANGWLVEGNEIRRNGIGNPGMEAVAIENGSGGATLRGNLLTQSEGAGADTFQSTGGNRLEENTLSDNGMGSGATLVNAGVRLQGAGSVVERNVITANAGAGILVTSGSTGNVISRNSISGNGPANGQLGIDLLAAAANQSLGSAPFVTLNDAGDADAGGNGLLNHPVLSGAILSGGSVILTGYARPGSLLELFLAAPDPSGFGEGATYLLSLTEGSGGDGDATTGTYVSPVNGLTVGTDTTNRFRFSIPTPPGVAAGTILTATATLGGQTSEFSGQVSVGLPANITLLKSIAPAGPQPPGADLSYSVLMTNTGSTPAGTIVLQDPVPAGTDLKVGSASTSPGTSGLTAVVEYSSDGGVTWTYAPAGGAGGAPAGYDRMATHIRWIFSGNLGATAPANQCGAGFVARIR
jgi:uncharacterized repeat protein (TIGR01451 family)